MTPCDSDGPTITYAARWADVPWLVHTEAHRNRMEASDDALDALVCSLVARAGMLRAMRILPEPLFVHSELATAVQLADLVAYIISWGVRFGPMTEPVRTALQPLADLVCRLRYRTTRKDYAGDQWPVWSFKFIPDLRPGDERE